MPSAAYHRFLESMNITYMMWHDGDGYAVDAFADMTPEERAGIESQLIARLAGQADWRDIDALASLATPAAVAAIDKARTHRNPEVKKHALQYFLDRRETAPVDPEQLDQQVADSVKRGAIDLAPDHPTPRVKQALLDLARLGDDVQRVNAAAMLLYVCGQAKEPFDWEQRPFFLRFNAEGHDLYIVWQELRARVGL